MNFILNIVEVRVSAFDTVGAHTAVAEINCNRESTVWVSQLILLCVFLIIALMTFDACSRGENRGFQWWTVHPSGHPSFQNTSTLLASFVLFLKKNTSFIGKKFPFVREKYS